jgi:Zn-dependent M28 family amino/carboxypeptidase
MDMRLKQPTSLIVPFLVLGGILGTSCVGDRPPVPGAFDKTLITDALAGITAEGLLAHTKALSADSMEGRAPASAGEDKTVAYLVNAFQQLGLTSANPDGSFVQNVTLMGFTAKPTASFSVGTKTIPLSFPDDYVAVSRHDKPTVDVNAEMVFVGYGVVAPEYDWDDYKGMDVKGKVLVMLVNDPAVRSSKDSSVLDASVFKGDAMTYYGRWTYKYEIASAKGAVGAIIIHEDGPAGYPYEVVRNSWSRENFDIKAPDGNVGRTAIEAWLTQARAEELLKAAGQDFAALKAAAARKDFRPVALGATVNIHLQNTTRTVQSKNVAATLRGSDSSQHDEYVIYSAHWDHYGRDTTLAGDQIFNGALDNASGVATMLEIAKGYTLLDKRPPRSVMFLAVTAEEQGLLGAKYFAEQPLVPLTNVLANINMDGFNQWGKTKDVVVVGFGNSTLDDVLADVLAPSGRVLAPDPEPGKGYFYRSDHFEFAKKGVPALYLDNGTQFIGRDSAYGITKRQEYVEKDYHKPSDEVKADWDLSGATEDARALFEVGYRVLTSPVWPSWKSGTEFKALRDSTLAAAKK